MVKSWAVYSIIRVALFFGVFALCMVANAPFWLAAIIAAIFNLCFSYLFLRNRRDELVTGMQARKAAGVDAASDEAIEDEPADSTPLDSTPAQNEPTSDARADESR